MLKRKICFVTMSMTKSQMQLAFQLAHIATAQLGVSPKE